MKLYLVSGTHPHSPGRRQHLRLSAEAAATEAHGLISAVAADLSYDDTIPAANDWEAHLAAVKADNADEDFDVWIDELAVEDVKPLPAALEDLLAAGEEAYARLADVSELHSPEEDAAIALGDAMQMVRFASLYQSSFVVPPLMAVDLEKLKEGVPGAVTVMHESPPCKSFGPGSAPAGTMQEAALRGQGLVDFLKETGPLPIPDRNQPPRIVIEVDGGNVVDVYSDRPMEYRCIDMDTEGVDNNLIDVPRPDGATEEAYRGGLYDATVAPAFIAAVEAAEERDAGEEA